MSKPSELVAKEFASAISKIYFEFVFDSKKSEKKDNKSFAKAVCDKFLKDAEELQQTMVNTTSSVNSSTNIIINYASAIEKTLRHKLSVHSVSNVKDIIVLLFDGRYPYQSDSEAQSYFYKIVRNATICGQEYFNRNIAEIFTSNINISNVLAKVTDIITEYIKNMVMQTKLSLTFAVKTGGKLDSTQYAQVVAENGSLKQKLNIKTTQCAKLVELLRKCKVKMDEIMTENATLKAKVFSAAPIVVAAAPVPTTLAASPVAAPMAQPSPAAQPAPIAQPAPSNNGSRNSSRSSSNRRSTSTRVAPKIVELTASTIEDNANYDSSTEDSRLELKSKSSKLKTSAPTTAVKSTPPSNLESDINFGDTGSEAELFVDLGDEI